MNGAPDVPVGHLTGSQRVNAGEGVDVVLDAVTNYGASLINCHGEFFIHGTGGVHAAVQNCGVQIGGDHHTDADVGIVVADILDIGHLVIGTAGDKLHVFTLVLCRIRFDLRIGIEGISGLIFAGVAAAFLGYIRPQFRSRGCAVGDAGVFTVQAGLQQVNLDVSHGKRIGGRLGVGEVSKRCAHDGDRQQGDAEAKRGDFLFHVLLLLLFIMFSSYMRRKMLENQSKG